MLPLRPPLAANQPGFIIRCINTALHDVGPHTGGEQNRLLRFAQTKARVVEEPVLVLFRRETKACWCSVGNGVPFKF